MSSVEDTELVDTFEQFFREYYQDPIGELARKYPTEQRSLYVDWDDLYRFDPDLADDYLAQPEQLQESAEEALRLYDLPIDVSLGQAHVRVHNLPETTDIRAIRAEDVNRLVAVRGIVRKATDVRPKVREAAFRCQRCETLTRVPQTGGTFQEPHECRGCDRQGPFRLDEDQSEFVDAQRLRIQESPEGLRGGETPQNIDVDIEDDITGDVSPGDRVRVVGVLRLDQESNADSPVFDVYMEGVAVDLEEEEFEDMDITDDDKQAIVDLSNTDDVYDRMIDSIAPSIHGYEREKLAIALQLFSGVTKNLPDGSRIRGDLHMLLIGDPGTGKCVSADTSITMADGTETAIGPLVERHLEEPVAVDDGYYAETDLDVLTTDGQTVRPGTATRVWKREAPAELIRIHTAAGRTLDVTPTHPLFVYTDDRLTPVVAADLAVGDRLATDRSSDPVAPDGGRTTTPAAHTDPFAGPSLDVDPIEHIETVESSDEWVYDLEVDDTHAYLADGIVSHNSQLLQYIRNIAPRSVYTSGKGSSSAGLCVTGDTRIHTDEGFVPIRDIATAYHPDPVSEETATTAEHGLYTYDREDERVEATQSSHVWRMPEKPCRRIETAHGKQLEASINTPVLVCDADGVEWRPISEVDPGVSVAVPQYRHVDRSSPSIRDVIGRADERVTLSPKSVEFVRTRLRETHDTLRDAASALDLPEALISDAPSNRSLSLDTLDRILTAIGADRDDLDINRVLSPRGDDTAIPDAFNADLLYLLGLVFGNGDVVDPNREGGHIRFSNAGETLLRQAATIIEEQFDTSVEIKHQEDQPLTLQLQSATAVRFFRALGAVSPKADRDLDPQLTTADHADAFLRGLFDATGTIGSHADGGVSVQLSIGSPELAAQVQLMLETYGVRARIRECDRQNSSVHSDDDDPNGVSAKAHLTIYGRNVDAFADNIGFNSSAKAAALAEMIQEADYRNASSPSGDALALPDGAGTRSLPISRDEEPSEPRPLIDLDTGDRAATATEAANSDLWWDEVIEASDTGEKEVFDLTVPETHNFLGNGLVTHNTAAAVRDDFGDGQQWTLEAGALVLADRGIAAIDELDKMRCVTGDTRVRCDDGHRRIRDIAAEAATQSAIETLPNGRTIRDVDLAVRTMTDDGRLVTRPVTAIHEYESPEKLYEVTLTTGESLTTTADHPFFVLEDGERATRPAAALTVGDRTCVPRAEARTDGGTLADADASPIPSASGDITWRRVASVRPIQTAPSASDQSYSRVYDLTVAGTHNFVANGVVVHNSEDRSAMHEALEQQSYHPDTEVLLADGRRVPIGRFVDERVADHSADIIEGVDCEILPVDDVRVHSVDRDAETIEKVPVDRVSRHKAPEEFVRVRFMNGRSVTVTPEHPLFVADDRETIPASSIEPGDRVPIPTVLPNAPGGATLAPATAPEHLTPALAELAGLLVAASTCAPTDGGLRVAYDDRTPADRLDTLVADLDAVSIEASPDPTSRHLDAAELIDAFAAVTDGRVPAPVLGSSRAHIQRFLAGAFVVAGRQSPPGIDAPTRALGGDYADAFAKLGIQTTVTPEGVTVAQEHLDRFNEVVLEGGDPAVTLDDPLETVEVFDVETIPNEDVEWVYDVTVEPTHTFVSQGLLLHNSISISKAGINATLKSRCSLLGAANPTYGRFDHYEPIGEQIDLEPALISRFDLIFTVTDQPDPDEDRRLAQHILTTNYAGELNTQREEMPSPEISRSEVESIQESVEPAIDPELLRKYVAYAKQNCHPRMTESARAAIEEFYVDLRSQGAEEDAPVPVTARKLEALVRLAEASARIRLSDTVTQEDADRVIEIVRSSLQNIGVDPETGQFDADVVETGTSTSQRKRIQEIKDLISEMESEYDDGVPVEAILDRADEVDLD
ncbi:MAG: LAGLIDADG family homing endonuclease, partial [Salinarchaeum sp.]